MTYSQQSWDDNNPTYPVSAARMLHMEQGIGDAHNAVAGVVNAQAYGPDATGATDASAAMQAAVTAAAGGVLRIPAGTYAIGTAVTIPNHTQIIGSGYGTVMHATGNNYIWAFNPGQRSRVAHMRLRAASAQTAGGGFDYTNALFNVYIDHIYFDSNLHTAFKVVPAAQGGLYHFNHIRFNGGAGMNTGWSIGDGTNPVTDVHLTNVVGTASTAADMANAWIDTKNVVDSLQLTDCLFFAGTNGIVLGVAAAAGAVTNTKFTNVVTDSIAGYGIRLNDVSRLDLVGCAVQSCGTATVAGINIGGGCYSVTMTGGIVQNCVLTGIAIQATAIDTIINGVQVLNNNTGNTASVYGIQVSAGTTDFTITNCRVANNALGATNGHQKRGIGINTGASDNFRVVGNDLRGNETSGLLNNATGVNQYVAFNIGGVAEYQTIATDANFTLTPTASPASTRHTGTLTADRTITLTTTGAATGQRFRVTRTGGGAFNLIVGGLKNLATGQWAMVEFDGTAWYLSQFGSL